MIENPIILKELIQVAHHRRTFLIRAGLPALTVALLAPQVVSLLGRYGQDWRAIAMVSRPLFETSAWLQFVAFSGLAFSAGTSVLHQEWTNRTIEVLCTTPLSRAKIVYGKFAAVLSQVLMMALALLPITGVLYYMGRLPREVALGSFIVIIGSVLFFGSIALLQAALFRPREGRSPVVIIIIAPLLLVLAFLDAYVWVRHPVLEALIPPRALYLVLRATAPGGWTTGGFAILSFGLMAGVGVVALLLAPRAFAATFARSMRGERRTGVRAALHRLARGRRPTMKPGHDPFVWQEKGASTRLVRWALWLVYGITAIFFFGGGLYFDDFTFLYHEEFYGGLAIGGIVAVTLAAGGYGATPFAREKSRRTAHALLLTGHPPWRFYRAKIRAVYWALRYSFVPVVIVILVWAVKACSPSYGYYDAGEIAVMLVAFLEALFVAPAIAVIVGMVFSSAASTPQRAIGTVMLGVLLAVALGFVLGTIWDMVVGGWWDPGDWFLPLLVVTVIFIRANRTWSPLRLSVLFALCLVLFPSATIVVAEVADDIPGYSTAMEMTFFLVAINVVLGALAALWLVLGLRTFDAGMAGEPAGAKRKW